jgi:hypothetical protein
MRYALPSAFKTLSGVAADQPNADCVVDRFDDHMVFESEWLDPLGPYAALPEAFRGMGRPGISNWAVFCIIIFPITLRGSFFKNILFQQRHPW